MKKLACLVLGAVLLSPGPPRQPTNWGVLAAWSWGPGRALDFLVKDPAIDAQHSSRVFLACVAASPVYELLGKKGLGGTSMPAPDHALTSGDLAFRRHEGGPTDAPDWPAFPEFAGKYFPAAPAK